MLPKEAFPKLTREPGENTKLDEAGGQRWRKGESSNRFTGQSLKYRFIFRGTKWKWATTQAKPHPTLKALEVDTQVK